MRLSENNEKHRLILRMLTEGFYIEGETIDELNAYFNLTYNTLTRLGLRLAYDFSILAMLPATIVFMYPNGIDEDVVVNNLGHFKAQPYYYSIDDLVQEAFDVVKGERNG